MTQTNHEMIPIVLTSTMGTNEWDVELPVDVPVQAIISKLVKDARFNFRERNDAGNLVPYRLLWQEENRYLSETETLQSAGVQRNNTLVMAHEPRAGGSRRPGR